MSWQTLSGFNQLAGNATAGLNLGSAVDSSMGAWSGAPTAAYGPAMDFSSLAGSTAMPQAPGVGLGAGAGGIGPMGYAQAGIAGLQTIANIWGGIQAQKMAKKQFKLNKNMALINLANQVKSYNTALADRARGRAVMESQTDAERDAYVTNNSLSTTRNRPKTP